MADALVSVIMPVYNGEAYLREAIDSALAQTYRTFELIAVDDGSRDGSAAILAEYGDRVRVVRDGRGGSAGIARRKGIARAGGSYLAFLDQDDLWSPLKLEKQVAFMDAHPEVGLSFTSFKILTSHGYQHHDFYAERPQVRTQVDLASLFSENSIYMPTPMLRRSTYDQVGGLDERLMGTDDFHLWMKVATVSRIGFLPEVLGVYRLHGTNTSGDHALMLKNEYQALKLLIDESAEARERLGNPLVRERLADQAYRVAHRLRDAGDLAEAAVWTARALRANPFDAKNYLVHMKYVLTARGWFSRAVARS
ncbi:MAG TPA: glycosyltransferase [Vicinamibacterales bacterium]|nr:glycosyltransferase [Vicinamibacterales bacterium]